MPRLLSWSVIAGFVACLNKPTFATITPDYTFFDSDGCYPVVIQGHHLGTTATVRIGDAEIIDLLPAEEDTDRPDYAQDVGFLYTGLIPASSTGAPGWADVTVTVDGEDLVLNDGFYYRSCPGGVVAESVTVPYTPGTAPTPTTTTYSTPYDYYSDTPDYSVDVTQDIQLEGCGLDPATTTIDYTEELTGLVTSIAVVGVCAPSSATADIPDGLAPGNYTVELVRDATRIRLSPYRCGVPSTVTYYGYYYDTAGFDCPYDITIPGGGP